MDKIFGYWPSLAELARDIEQDPVRVRQWKGRGSIPAKHDLKIVAAAERRGYPVTLQDLAVARSIGLPDGASSAAR